MYSRHIDFTWFRASKTLEQIKDGIQHNNTSHSDKTHGNRIWKKVLTVRFNKDSPSLTKYGHISNTFV